MSELEDDRPVELPIDLDEFVQSVEWTFAKTMPTIPHWYVMRGRSRVPVEWHDWFARQIAENGYKGKFFGRTYTYLDHDGFKYWVVGEAINREPLKEVQEA